VRSAVRLMAVVFEVCEKNRPKRVSTSLDHAFRQMLSEHAVSFLLHLEDCFVRDHRRPGRNSLTKPDVFNNSLES